MSVVIKIGVGGSARLDRAMLELIRIRQGAVTTAGKIMETYGNVITAADPGTRIVIVGARIVSAQPQPDGTFKYGMIAYGQVEGVGDVSPLFLAKIIVR